MLMFFLSTFLFLLKCVFGWGGVLRGEYFFLSLVSFTGVGLIRCYNYEVLVTGLFDSEVCLRGITDFPLQ